MEKIIEHAIITYTDGLSEQFPAICITERGVTIGRILKNETTGKEEFTPYGFINKGSIKQIKRNGEKKM